VSGNYSLFRKVREFSVLHLVCFSIIKIVAFEFIVLSHSLLDKNTWRHDHNHVCITVFRQMRTKFNLMQLQTTL